MEVQIAKGYFWKIKNGPGGRRVSIEILQDALTAQADCGPCGCNDCEGYTTQINSETGELMMLYITGAGTEGDPYVQNITTYTLGLPIVKALKADRT